MLMKTALAALLGLTVAAEAATVRQHRSTGLERRQNRFGGGNNGGNNNNNNNNNNGGDNGNNGGSNNGDPTCLAPEALQTGSQSTGQNGGQAADGQVNSAT